MALTVGRYRLHAQIARGGMATIHIARVLGDVGFSRIVAAKRLQPQLAEDAELVKMFIDEARIASKVHHRNVVPVLDVVTMGDELVLVQEYVHGVPLSWLLRHAHQQRTHIPIPVVVSIACQILAGLHAAHETVDEMGTPLKIVHRDVSPQNIMIATDGTARLLDFGVAKAAARAAITKKGTFKGKLGYSSPEQLRGHASRQSDVHALSIVLWEMLVGRRYHPGNRSDTQLIKEIMTGAMPTVTEAMAGERSWVGAFRWSQLEGLEPIVQLGLAIDQRLRWPTAQAMEKALATALSPASTTEVAAWVCDVGKEFLATRDQAIAEDEVSYRRSAAMPRMGSPEGSGGMEPQEPTRADSPRTFGRSSESVLAARGSPRLARSLGPFTTSVVQTVRQWFGGVRHRPWAAIGVAALCVFAVALGAALAVRDSATEAAVAPAPGPSWFVPPQPPPPPRVVPAIAVPEACTPAPVVEPPPRPVHHERPKHHEVHEAPARPPRVKEKPDCAPPYYFRGQKKVFKPQCL